MSSIANKFESKENSEEIFQEIRTYLDTSLIQLADSLEKHNVKYHLDAGTLLGAYRDGTSLTKDSDHDISITIEELMKPSGQAWLREFKDHLGWNKRVIHGKPVLDNFIPGEELLERIESGKPFIISNLGWEGLFDGKSYKYQTYRRATKHKIDVFIQYPWNAVIGGPERCPKAIDHHVFKLAYWGEFFARTPSFQFNGELQKVTPTYHTMNGPVTRTFPGYADIETYFENLYGSDWRIPSSEYFWHGPKTYLESKVFKKDLYTNEIKTVEQIEAAYLFDPSLLN